MATTMQDQMKQMPYESHADYKKRTAGIRSQFDYPVHGREPMYTLIGKSVKQAIREMESRE